MTSNISVSLVDLERQLKTVTKSGKYVVGRKEVSRGLKGTKLLIWSGSAGIPPQILHESRNLSIPSIRFEGSPIELGRTCGIPYKVSLFAVKSPGDAIISQFENFKDYGLEQTQKINSSAAVAAVQKQEDKTESKQSKPRRKTKEKTDSEVKTRKKKLAETAEEDQKGPSKKKEKVRKSGPKKPKKDSDADELDEADED